MALLPSPGTVLAAQRREARLFGRYDPMVGATDRRGSVVPAEKMSRRLIAAQEESIRLKGPGEARRLLAPGQSSTSDQYTRYWEQQEASRPDGKTMREESAHNQTFFGKKEHAPKLVAQTRYMPLEVEHRDAVQRELMKGIGPMQKLGHGE